MLGRITLFSYGGFWFGFYLGITNALGIPSRGELVLQTTQQLGQVLLGVLGVNVIFFGLIYIVVSVILWLNNVIEYWMAFTSGAATFIWGLLAGTSIALGPPMSNFGVYSIIIVILSKAVFGYAKKLGLDLDF